MKYTKSIAANFAVRAFLRQKSASIDPDSADYDFNSICKEWDYMCAYCGEEGRLQRDHVIGMNKDDVGLDLAQNIVPVCRSCNNYKQKNKYGYEATIKNRMDDEMSQKKNILRIRRMMDDYEGKVPLLCRKLIKDSCARIYDNVVNAIVSELGN